jgi:hypothetical protein
MRVLICVRNSYTFDPTAFEIFNKIAIFIWHSVCYQLSEAVFHFEQFGRSKKMSDGESTGSNMIWAITLIIIVAILAGAVYYSGILSGKSKQEIDVDVKVPAATR